VALAHGNSKPETLSKIVAHSGRHDLRHGVCAGRVFWGRAGGRIGLGPSPLQHRRSGAEPVIGVTSAANAGRIRFPIVILPIMIFPTMVRDGLR